MHRCRVFFFFFWSDSWISEWAALETGQSRHSGGATAGLLSAGRAATASSWSSTDSQTHSEAVLGQRSKTTEALVVAVQPANTNNTQPLLWSVKWPDMFGEWDTGVWTGVLVCVCRVWPEVCVCFLSVMAPDPLLQIKRSPLALNGPGGQSFPSVSLSLPSNVRLGCGWTGHDSVYEIQHSVRAPFPTHFSVYPSGASDLVRLKLPFEVAQTLR